MERRSRLAGDVQLRISANRYDLVSELFAVGFGHDVGFVILGVVVSGARLAAFDSTDHAGSCSVGPPGDWGMHGDVGVWFGNAGCEHGVLGTATGG